MEGEDWRTRRLHSVGLWSLQVSRRTAQVSPGRREAANMHPRTLAPATKSARSASGSNSRGSNGARSTHGCSRQKTAPPKPGHQRGELGGLAGRERAAGVALAGPGPSPASPRARPKVSSQSPRPPLAQPTAERNRLAARKSGPRRPGRGAGTPGRASLRP